MLTKAKPFPLLPAAVARSALTQNIIFVLVVNWICQGLRGMGKKELIGRLMIELVMVLGLALAAQAAGAAGLNAWVWALLGAHSLQFLLNGQFWVCLRYWPGWQPDVCANLRFCEWVVAVLRQQSWLQEAVCIGSCSPGRAMAGPRSDLDLRLIFPPGIAGFVRTHLLLLRLRATAWLRRVPLDLYALDGPSALERQRQDEPLGLILDRNGRLLRRFAACRRIVPWP
jgi:hypothetical protein